MLCFGLGLAALTVALLSPIAVVTGLLFSMHMVQHVLLTVIAPLLILLGAPQLTCLWGLPGDLRGGVGTLLRPTGPLHRMFHILTHPLVAAPLFFATVAIWHVPSLYDAAQGRTFAHDLEHLLFMTTAFMYWWPVIHPTGGRRRLSHGAALLSLFVASIEGTFIGALLTFARSSLYSTYQRVPRASSLTALEDQQLAGLIMWIPGGLLFLAAAVGSFIVLVRNAERMDEEGRPPSPSSASSLVAIMAALSLAFAGPSSVSANGGTIQVSMERAGPYEVTVLTDPSPIRVGTVDVSVMVELPGGDLVQDARVMVTARSMGDPRGGGTYEATHDRATNKLFYAADVPVSKAGPWQVEVMIIGSQGEGAVSFEIEASDPTILDRLPLLVLVAILVSLIVVSGAMRYRIAQGQRPDGGSGHRETDELT